MAIEFRQVTDILDSLSIKYKEVGENHLGMGFKTEHGSVVLGMRLEENGEYLRVRTVRWAECPDGHPNRDEVFEYLAGLNYERRMVRFGWDEDDGEIVVSVAVPLEDSETLNRFQLEALMAYMMSSVKDSQLELERLLSEKPATGSWTSSGETSIGRGNGSTPADGAAKKGALIFAVGVLLMGVAAILGVLILLFR